MLETAKSIRFDTRQVKATLDGTMTEIRMPIKPQPEMHDFGNHEVLAWVKPALTEGYLAVGVDRVRECPFYLKLPHQPGDILYVRETWWANKKRWREADTFLYLADAPFPEGWSDSKEFKWRPSIHMPKEAARIFLKVTDVRVERVQDITREDAVAEGIPEYLSQLKPNYLEEDADIWRNRTTVENYAELWDSIHKSRGCGWDLNPWVRVTKFERLEGK